MTIRIQLAGVALAASFVIAQGHAASPLTVGVDTPPSSNWRDTSLAEYRQHLVELSSIIDACAKARDAKSCDPALVGQDDRVPAGNVPNAERRLAGYGWLRALLSKAQEKDATPAKPQNTAQNKPQNAPQNHSQGAPAVPVQNGERDLAHEPTRPPKPTTSQLLQAAEARLTQDIAQVDALAAASPSVPADHSAQRAAMKQVLAERDFRSLQPPTARDSMWEKLGRWLNILWANAARLQIQAAWVGRAIVWGFILAVCVGLVWGLLQMERRWRIRLVPESEAPAAGAASARDWQLWLKDARRSAAGGEWRDAVHFVYWAAISRLESKRLWPADRARTPREYLALVAAEDSRRRGLATLTGNFERTWYGGRPAEESDYLKAEELAASLLSGSADSAGPTDGGVR